MIKPFRKNILKSFPESKTKRYLRYAIGEIILVVIGILIALQINNWNETQKMNNWEHRFLTDLKRELKTNLDQLEGINNSHLLVGKSCDDLKSALQTATIIDKPKIDSLYRITLYQTTFFPTTGVYDSGVAAGKIENIRNDQLKYDIMNLYNHYYKRLVYNGQILDGVIGQIDLHRDEYFDRTNLKLKSWEYVKSPEFLLKIEYLKGRNVEYTYLTKENVKAIRRIISSISADLGEQD